MNKKIETIIAKLREAKTELSEQDATVEAVTETTPEQEATQLAEAMIEGVKIEADEFAVGQAVFAVSEEGERVPLAEGSYRTDEGNMFTVDENGLIASIGEAEEAEEAEEEQEMADESKAEAPAKKVIESQTVSKETFFSEINALKTELATIRETHKVAIEAKDAEIENLKTELSSTPSEVATKAAPSEPKKIEAKFNRAKGVNAKTTKDRVLQRLYGNK